MKLSYKDKCIIDKDIKSPETVIGTFNDLLEETAREVIILNNNYWDDFVRFLYTYNNQDVYNVIIAGSFIREILDLYFKYQEEVFGIIKKESSPGVAKDTITGQEENDK